MSGDPKPGITENKRALRMPTISANQYPMSRKKTCELNCAEKLTLSPRIWRNRTRRNHWRLQINISITPSFIFNFMPFRLGLFEKLYSKKIISHRLLFTFPGVCLSRSKSPTEIQTLLKLVQRINLSLPVDMRSYFERGFLAFWQQSFTRWHISNRIHAFHY